jgi:archaeal chaperonin
MSNTPMQPIFILPEDTKRTTGDDARKNNIEAAKLVAQTIQSTLGPKGMDKMLVDSSGQIVVTNDGVTILKEMNIEHPAAKLVADIAKTQEDTIGDGTTTAVILAGELLSQAQTLLEQNIHPTIIAQGYKLAQQEANKKLKQIATPLSINQFQTLQNIAITAMTGKGAQENREELANLVAQAAQKVTSKPFNTDNIKIESVIGKAQSENKLIAGLILDKERTHPAMPIKIHQAKIALIDAPLEIKNTEIDAKIQITDPNQLSAFLDQEEKTLRDLVDKIHQTGANVLFCQRGIDDLAQHFLANKGILAIRRVTKSDMEKLSLATGAQIISSFKELTPQALGIAQSVSEQKIIDDPLIFIEGCKNPEVITLLLHTSTEHIAQELKRALSDALGDIAAALNDGFTVTGAGSVEMQLATHLNTYASSLQGREQLAVQAFAKALEIIPLTLAKNAGLDPLEIITALRTAHKQNQTTAGLNVFTGRIMNALEQGVIEPLAIKTQALSSATQVAEMILRVDDVIMSSGSNSQNSFSPSQMM